MCVAAGDTGASPIVGYISNLRVVKNVTVYTSNFTPPTAPVTNITNTSLLLNFTNGGIYDATSKNVLETVGDAKISTAQSKWGGSSMAFDGTGDYLPMPANTQSVLFGAGNFTIECWLYKNANTAYMILCGNFQTASENTFQILADVTGTKIGWYNGATNSFTVTGATTLNTNTWYHIAFVRSGTTLTLYVNGTSDGSSSLTTDYNNTTRLFFVGQAPELIAARNWNGYLQDFRITRGYARYTSNFTIPSSAFPTQ
ncbi:LamG domain-containing protein [bacterium]|nr:LamG domain-containing protein [bacterium]